MAQYGALATLDIDGALSEIANGMLSKQIAARYDVNPKTLRDKLKRADPDAYAEAIAAQTDSIVEEATSYALECADKDDAPIARVRLEGAYRYARAKNPAIYGDKSEIHHTGHITLDALLVAYDAAQSVAAPAIEQTAQRDDSKDNDAIGE